MLASFVLSHSHHTPGLGAWDLPLSVRFWQVAVQAIESKETKAVEVNPSAYMLTSDVFLVMHAGGSVFVWIGKAVPMALRDDAFTIADAVKADNGIAAEVPVEVVKQALEGPLFTAHFDDWDGVQLAAVQEAKRIAVLGAEAATAAADAEAAEARKRDLEALAAGGAEEPAMVDDGSGKKKVLWLTNMHVAHTHRSSRSCARRDLPCVRVDHVYALVEQCSCAAPCAG